MKTKIKTLLNQWKEEYQEVKNQLIEQGAKANSLEYNLLACEALRLSECINDLTDLLLIDEEKENS